MKMIRIKISQVYLCFWVLILAERLAQCTASRILNRDWVKKSDEVIRESFLDKNTPSIGIVRILVLRVSTSNGDTPENNATKLSDLFFGTHGNKLHHEEPYDAATFFSSCSGGRLKVVPAVGPDVIDGVKDIEIDIDETIYSGISCENYVDLHYHVKFHELNKELGIKYEHLAFIVPAAVCNGAGGQGGGTTSVYFGSSENWPITLIGHEVGHSMQLGHSSTLENGQVVEYGDHSCVMGTGVPDICYNAAMSWNLGWYSDKNKEGHLDLFDFDKYGLFWRGRLVGIDDYVNNLFDDSQDRVIVRLHDLFIYFNRAKGISKGTKAYHDKVVVNKRKTKFENSFVEAVLDDDPDSSTYILPHFTSPKLNIVIRVCSIEVQNPRIEPKDVGVASQSSTDGNNVASNAIDGNAHTVSNTAEWDGNWWQFQFFKPTTVQRVVVFNIIKSWGWGREMLDGAVVKLLNENEVVLAHKKIHGTDIDSITLDFENPYDVKVIRIEAATDHNMILADVEFYGPTQSEQASAEYANVISYISDDGNKDLFSCDTKPSLVPDGVKLVRNSEKCVKESATNDHPEHFKCPIQPTIELSSPGSHDNAGLLLYTKKHKAWGCVIAVQPIYWSYEGHSFYFESKESFHAINECFAPGSNLQTNIPPKPTPVIPSNVILVRSDSPCVHEKAKEHDWLSHDRFYCPISKTVENLGPWDGEVPLELYGHDCGVELTPMHWSYSGTTFYFTSTKDIETINACFVPGVHLTEYPPVRVERKHDGSSCQHSSECMSSICEGNICGMNPTLAPMGEKAEGKERFSRENWHGEKEDFPRKKWYKQDGKERFSHKNLVGKKPERKESFTRKYWYQQDRKESVSNTNLVGEKSDGKERFPRNNFHGERKDFLRKNLYQQDGKERVFYKNLVDEPVRKESFSHKNLHGERKDFLNKNSYEQENKEHFFRKISHQEDRKERFFRKNSEHNHLKTIELQPYQKLK